MAERHWIHAFDESPFNVDITEEEFRSMWAAHRSLAGVTSIEEKLDALLENVREYEESLLTLATKHSLYSLEGDLGELHSDRRTMTRRLANVLTAARSYTDQVPRVLDAICQANLRWRGGWDGEMKTVRRSFAYRAMHELRDHIQHADISVGGVSVSWRWTGRPDDSAARLQHRIIPLLDVERLARSDGEPENARGGHRRFAPAVLSQLRAEAARQGKGGALPLTPLLRQYVEGLARAHESLRESLKPGIELWERQYGLAARKALEASGTNDHGTLEVKRARDGAAMLSFHIVPENLIDYRRTLETKNRHFAKLSLREASGAQ